MLAAAGRIPGNQVDELLHELHLAPAWFRTDVDARPAFVRRPVLPEGGGSETPWLEGVNDDVADHAAGNFVLGEITCYRGRHVDSRYEWSQLRLLGVLMPPTGDPTELVHNLPTGSPIQLVAQAGLGAMPRWELVINPYIAEQLHCRRADRGRPRAVKRGARRRAHLCVGATENAARQEHLRAKRARHASCAEPERRRILERASVWFGSLSSALGR